jgi:hypothetical protein
VAEATEKLGQINLDNVLQKAKDRGLPAMKVAQNRRSTHNLHEGMGVVGVGMSAGPGGSAASQEFGGVAEEDIEMTFGDNSDTAHEGAAAKATARVQARSAARAEAEARSAEAATNSDSVRSDMEHYARSAMQ